MIRLSERRELPQLQHGNSKTRYKTSVDVRKQRVERVPTPRRQTLPLVAVSLATKAKPDP